MTLEEWQFNMNKDSKAGNYVAIVWGLSIFAFFVLILLLNFNTGLLVDDFVYTRVYSTSKEVANIKDIIDSQINHYFLWGGRNVLHFLVQLFLLIGKPVFNVLNSIVYILLVLLICFNSNCKDKQMLIYLFLFANLLIWFFVPSYGQDILWLTGSCNYLWGIVFVLGMLYLYRSHLEHQIGDSIVRCIGIFIFGVLSGWTNENTSAAMIVMLSLFILYYKFNKIKIPVWSIMGLIGSIVGFIIMIVAPGNYIRKQHFVDDRPFLEIFISRFKDITKMGIRYLLPMAIIFIVLMCMNLYFELYRKINFAVSIIYFIGGLAAMYAMVMSPYFPERAWFGIIVLFILSLGSLYANLNRDNRLVAMLTVSFLILLIPLFVYSYIGAYSDISRTNKLLLEREEYILEQKAQGNMDVYVDQIFSGSKYNACLNDVQQDTHYWINEAVSNYYGINNITAK